MASGCRLGEALGLTWDNVCYDKSEIHIDRQLNKKLEFKPLKQKVLIVQYRFLLKSWMSSSNIRQIRERCSIFLR